MSLKKKQTNKPEWTPKDAGPEFTSNVMDGIQAKDMQLSADKNAKRQIVPRQKLDTKEYVRGILSGDRVILARAITLIESNAATHLDQAQEVLGEILPHTGKSIRVGITGVPGAGKSTFIEALGVKLIGKGHKVAVLAVDPSSSVSGGSILGDKTRMAELAALQESFIRPSPTGGALGGVTRKTRESILICEAAGYDVILVETVGVGQNEITVRSMVDFFMLLQIAGGGDELQGIKKGVMEIADAVLVNKADGDNIKKAEIARQDYEMALHYMHPATPGWQAHAFSCSASEGQGIDEIWKVVEVFARKVKNSGFFQTRRLAQQKEWLHSIIRQYLENIFYANTEITKEIPRIENLVKSGKLPVTAAAKKLLKIFEKK